MGISCKCKKNDLSGETISKLKVNIFWLIISVIINLKIIGKINCERSDSKDHPKLETYQNEKLNISNLSKKSNVFLK